MIVMNHPIQTLITRTTFRRIDNLGRFIITINLTAFHVFNPSIFRNLTYASPMLRVRIKHREQNTTESRRVNMFIEERNVRIVGIGYGAVVVLVVPFIPAANEFVVERGGVGFGSLPEAAVGGHTEHDYGGTPYI